MSYGMNAFAVSAKGYHDFGWSVMPAKGKRGILKCWQDMSTDTLLPKTVDGWVQKYTSANIGVVCGEVSDLFVLDVDGQEGRDSLREHLEELQKFPHQITGGGGLHFFFKHPQSAVFSNKVRLIKGVDIKTTGGQAILPPSVHPDTGNVYKWVIKPTGLGASKEIPEADLQAVPDWLIELLKTETAKEHVKLSKRTMQFIECGASEGQRNSELFVAVCDMHGNGLTVEEINTKARQGCQRCNPPLVDEIEIGKTIQSALSGQRTPSIPAESKAQNGNGYDFPHTDDANAERFAKHFGSSFRFCVDSGWMYWDGKRWKHDKRVVKVRQAAPESIKRIAEESGGIENLESESRLFKHISSSLSHNRIKAMIGIAESKRPFPCNIDSFDVDPMSLNLQNGTLDLSTGEFKEHSPKGMHAKVAGASYDPDATCPQWEAFLDTVFGSDCELIDFVQRAVGYSLTGKIDEECFFVLYGLGANGKSTFLETVSRLIGEYSCPTPSNTLMAKAHDSGQTNDLARLCGSRFVVASETEQGKMLAESKLKDLTGGETITARFLHKEFFSFRPTFKIWMAANHKPRIKGTDEGIWRRIKLIPFNVQIPQGDRDPSLKGDNGKLANELSGILNWALEGAAMWKRDGLQEPDAVTQATSSYRAESDIILQFVNTRCIVDPNATVMVKELYEEYVNWCNETGEYQLSKVLLGKRLRVLHFESFAGSMNQKYWRGLGLLVE